MSGKPRVQNRGDGVSPESPPLSPSPSRLFSPVRVLPLNGKPLEFEAPGTAKCVFAAAGGGFLIGPENRLLETAVLAILQRDTLPSPLAKPPVYLFRGGTGTGKTHVLRGLHAAWTQSHRKRRSIYVRGADFARQLAEAIDLRTVDDFQERYRHAAFLAVDGLDDLREKPAALEELLHTLDAVVAGGGIFLAGLSRQPEDFAVVDERLATRLEAGLIVPLALPGPEVRRVFVREVAAAFRTPLSIDVVARFADAFPGTLPELYGRFAQIYFAAQVAGTPLTAAEVKRHLQGAGTAPPPGIESIIRATSRHFSLKPAELKGRSRKSGVAEARAVAIYLARNMTGSSFREIGDHFSGRDHKTISYNYKRIDAALSGEPALDDAVREITAVLERKS